MALLGLLQKSLDSASQVLDYVGTGHNQLLEAASPLRNSYEFAWAAATQRGFHFCKGHSEYRG